MARPGTAAVLTNLADRSRVWLVTAVLLAVAGGRTGRRAALRGLVSLGLASALTNGLVKPVVQRRRPPPGRRRGRRRKTRTSSFPSGHAASAFAFAAGASFEAPLLGAPLVAAATAVAASRVTVGEHHVGDVVAGAVVGAATAAATTRVWPVAPRSPAQARRAPSNAATDPSPTGDGLSIVVNASAGPALGRDPASQLRDGLPDAEVIEVDDPDELDDALEQAAANGRALGIAGGDGSVNAAAAVADAAGKPLLVVPAGTLNHLARDLGLGSVQDAVDAVQTGSAAAVDLATIDGRPFLNTASFGSYVELVDAREHLQKIIGKWPAVVVALVRVLRNSSPCEVEIDGERKRVWMSFVGNCRYHPSGFAPSWRERLDDGQLDVRMVEGDAPFSRLRLVVAVLTGRLGRCRVYSQRLAREVHVRSLNGPMRLARDGETFDGSAEFVIAKDGRSLPVYVAPS
jgi:undecaprenyl-diphosphatase